MNRVTHTDERKYFMGRWFWIAKSKVVSSDCTSRYDYVYVGYGNNSDKWLYAEYAMCPNFARFGRARFTVWSPKTEVPF